jgi:hypothetical protein
MASIKETLRSGLNYSMQKLPFGVLLKINAKKILLPAYHVISDRRIPHVMQLFPYRNLYQFETDLDFFQKYFTQVTLSDLINYVNGKADLGERSFLLTFDDGYKEVYEVIAPILVKRSLSAVFLLNSAFIDNREIFFRNKANLLVERLIENHLPGILKELSLRLSDHELGVREIKDEILKINYQNRHLLDQLSLILDIDFN